MRFLFELLLFCKVVEDSSAQFSCIAEQLQDENVYPSKLHFNLSIPIISCASNVMLMVLDLVS